MSDEFGFKYDEEQVDQSTFKDDSLTIPSVAWIGKVRNEAQSGFWVIEVDSVKHLGTPEPYWQLKELQFGDSPNAPYVPCWVTRNLRCVPDSLRKRVISVDLDGTSYFYHYKTPKVKMVNINSYTKHTQVRITIPGLSDVCTLGLRGTTKTASWDNDPDAHYKVPGFGFGVWQKLTAYAKKASEQQGAKIPALCTWWIDLIPCYQDGEIYWVEVGNKKERKTTWMNPFTVDLRTGIDQTPKTRFVGMTKLLELIELRKSSGEDWEKEWNSFDDSDNEQSQQQYQEPGPVQEHDEIPF